MTEINLMDRYPTSRRPIVSRGKMLKLAGGDRIELDQSDYDNRDIVFEQRLLGLARQFGREYFDGDRLYGYGGYHYHPRFWTNTVKRFHEHYGLAKHASVLDVGCAKGFMLYDFKRLYPDLNVQGLDISQYAYEHAMPEVKPFIKVGDARKLPFADESFDLAISINTVSNLPLKECKQAIQEIQRVSRGHSFITVHAWRTNEERERLSKWNITAQTTMHVDEWKALFKEVRYTGDYYWFLLE